MNELSLIISDLQQQVKTDDEVPQLNPNSISLDSAISIFEENLFDEPAVHVAIPPPTLPSGRSFHLGTPLLTSQNLRIFNQNDQYQLNGKDFQRKRRR